MEPDGDGKLTCVLRGHFKSGGMKRLSAVFIKGAFSQCGFFFVLFFVLVCIKPSHAARNRAGR